MSRHDYDLSQEEKNRLKVLLENSVPPEQIQAFHGKLKAKSDVSRVTRSRDRLEIKELMEMRVELVRLYREWMKEMAPMS